MKKIVEVKEGLLGSVAAIMFLISLAGFILWWTFTRDPSLRIVAFIVSAFWFGGCILFICNIINPKSAFLAIDGNYLLWSIRTTESAAATVTKMPLRSLRRLEFVLPKMKFEGNARNYTFSKLFIVDVHGTRHRLPMKLLPGIHRKKIVAALKAEIPDIEVVESIDGVSDVAAS